MIIIIKYGRTRALTQVIIKIYVTYIQFGGKSTRSSSMLCVRPITTSLSFSLSCIVNVIEAQVEIISKIIIKISFCTAGNLVDGKTTLHGGIKTNCVMGMEGSGRLVG